jgi:pSer/pThr/pTyr-binding forkhead associated (FHA) protein
MHRLCGMAAATPPMFAVMVRIPGDPAVLHHRRGWSLTIGRDADCEITLPLVTVSRKHARITFDPTTGLIVHDLQSRNGTWVNNVPINRAPLRAGDCLRIGGAEINLSVRR